MAKSLNNLFQSMQIPDNTQIILYKKNSYEGATQTYQQSQNELGDFSQQISSFKSIDLTPSRIFDPHANKVCFYASVEHKGSEFCFEAGDYASVENSQDNLFKSVHIPLGMSINAYQDNNYAGKHKYYFLDESNLWELNRQISSFKVINNNLLSDSDSDSLIDTTGSQT